MPDCEEAIYSNDYFDFIVEKQFMDELEGEDEYCVQTLNENYEAVYYQMPDNNVEMQMRSYSYGVIPKCFGLLNNIALEDSGIMRVRDQPNLALTGQGVLIGFVDTDFDYTNPLFCNADGSTRVERIWNQEDRSGIPPSGFLYGTGKRGGRSIRKFLANLAKWRQKLHNEDGHGQFFEVFEEGLRVTAAGLAGAARRGA